MPRHCYLFWKNNELYSIQIQIKIHASRNVNDTISKVLQFLLDGSQKKLKVVKLDSECQTTNYAQNWFYTVQFFVPTIELNLTIEFDIAKNEVKQVIM